MSEQLTLAAETREQVGKGASRSLRREGRVPAVIYGDKKDPQAIHLEEKALMRALMTGHFMNSTVLLDVAGKSALTLPKDVAFDPVTDRPVHVDFLRIGEHSTVTVQVPVRFTDEDASPGIRRGGVLNIVRHDLELVCDASAIPDDVEVSLKGFDVGDSIHISSVVLPAGTKVTIEDRDFTVATIVAPSALKSSEGESDSADGTPAA